MPPTGLEAVFIANREKLLRFLIARGAGEAADDLVQDLWLKVSAAATGPIASPLSYLYRAADRMMIDLYRSRSRASIREAEWAESEGSDPYLEPTGERVIGARQEIEQVAATLKALGYRRETVFRRARLDGVPQRQIADELGVSLSTVEADLRAACIALARLRDTLT